MTSFLIRRLLQIVPVLLIVATLSFFMIHLAPGGPFSKSHTASKEVMANIERHYGLDQPLWKQYLHYMSHLAHGDLGPSFKYPTRSVNELIAQAFPVSAELGLLGLALSMAIGIPIGIVAAARHNTLLDIVPSAVVLLGICIPAYVLGPLLILIFAVDLGWLDASGWFNWTDAILPVLVIGAGGAAGFARMTRSGMLEILSQDYIRTARAKGASEVDVVLRHALRGGLTPVLSNMGPALADILTGSFAVELIFQIPGLGRLFVNSAFNRDYTMVLGSVLFYAALLLIFNLIFDMVMIAINPRLKYE